MAARSNAWVCGRTLPGIAGSNPFGGMGVCLMRVVCCQVEVSATGRSLVQRSPIECVRVYFSVIRCNNNPLYLQWVGRRGHTKRKKENV